MSPQRKPDGSRLLQYRKALGLTQNELARIIDYSARQVARWEAGIGSPRPAVMAQIEKRLPEPPSEGAFRFIDLFAGIGGFRLGLESAGGICAFTSEWDAAAQRTYRANFGDDDLHGDITQVENENIPDHDVLAAGFPCQPFSIAGVSKKNALGRRHGFEDETQGTLFFDVARIIAAKQPKAFILENVKNLVSHDRGRTFEVIVRTLREQLGYRVSWQIIDARRYLPQHRERIFIVGLRDDVQAKFVWNRVKLPAKEKGPLMSSVLHPEDGSEPVDPRYLDADGKVLPKYVLSEHLWTYLQNYARKHQAKGNGFGFGLVGPESVSRTISARYYKDGAEILVRRESGPPRRLTPLECARLMGFAPLLGKRAARPFRIVVSDTQAYKQFGNAVAVPVVSAIAKALVPYLRSERTGDGLADEQHKLKLAVG